jgi:methionine aminopeptidase
MTTEEIDALVHWEIIRHDAYPSPLGYGRFPKSVCTSVNNVLCHGIPDRYSFFNDVLPLWKLRSIARPEKHRGSIETYLHAHF